MWVFCIVLFVWLGNDERKLFSQTCSDNTVNDNHAPPSDACLHVVICIIWSIIYFVCWYTSPQVLFCFTDSLPSFWIGVLIEVCGKKARFFKCLVRDDLTILIFPNWIYLKIIICLCWALLFYLSHYFVLCLSELI